MVRKFRSINIACVWSDLFVLKLSAIFLASSMLNGFRDLWITLLTFQGHVTSLTSWPFHTLMTWHAHTVVWECCKDDRQSQWEMAKFDPQPTLNPWTDRHQIWNKWSHVRRGYLLERKIRVSPPRGFAPISAKYTLCSEKNTHLHFLSYLH